jgi:hypothetical protein
MVSGFYVDVMHTIYLNVCRELAGYVREECKSFVQVGTIRRKPVQQVYDELDARINICKLFCPREFNRRVSPLTKCGSWKAVEARQFFLYLAYGVFEGMVDPMCLELIALLQFYIYILGGTDPTPLQDDELEWAELIAECFIATWNHLRQCGCNITTHYLIHIIQDCRFFKCRMERLSTFKFENNQRPTKDMITSGYQMLSQIRTRLIEKERFVFHRDENENIIRGPDGSPSVGTMLHSSVILNKQDLNKKYRIHVKRQGEKWLRFPHFTLKTCGFRDSFALVRRNNGDYVILCCVDLKRHRRGLNANANDDVDGDYVIGYQYTRTEDLFVVPGPSRNQHVYGFSDPFDARLPLTKYPVHQVVAKLFVYPRFSQFTSQSENSRSVLMESDLGGEAFDNVKDWVGVALRHTGTDPTFASLY